MRVVAVLAALVLASLARSEPPNDRKDDLQLRLDDWLRGERAARDAVAGQVDPVWRDVQRSVAAVERALARRPRPGRPATVRFAVEAGVNVQPPTATRAAGDPRGTGVVASLKLKLDEATGRVEPRLWFTRRVVTRVRVLGVETR